MSFASSQYLGSAGIGIMEEQLPKLTFSCFDSEVAFSLGTLIRSTYSSEEGERTGVLITIRLFSGLTLFQSACGPNVNPTNEDWVRRKFNTVRDFGTPTLLKGRQLEKKGRDINSIGAEYAAHGGGYPIIVDSVGPIGAIIVSGLSQEEDHALVVQCIEKVKQQMKC